MDPVHLYEQSQGPVVTLTLGIDMTVFRRQGNMFGIIGTISTQQQEGTGKEEQQAARAE